MHLKSLRLIQKMAQRISEETLSGVGAELDKREAKDKIVLAELPDAVKRLFVCSSEFHKESIELEARRERLLLQERAKDKIDIEIRRSNQLAAVCRELAWSEILGLLDLKTNLLHLRAGWVVVVTEGEEEEVPSGLEEIAEVLVNGTPMPDGSFVKQVEDGFLMAINRKHMEEKIRAKAEEKRLKASKPN